SEAAAAVGLEPDFVAVPLLSFGAGTIGTNRRLAVKSDYIVLPVIWTVVVAPSGVGKSPAMAQAQRPVTTLQKRAFARANTSGGGLREDEHLFTTDTTVEAIVKLASANRGFVVIHDEIVGWVRSFNAYRG